MRDSAGGRTEAGDARTGFPQLDVARAEWKAFSDLPEIDSDGIAQ